jgi:hypothetical protein
MTTSQSTAHHNNCALTAFQLQQFEWILYGFGSGHFNSSTCNTHLIPFSTKLAADPSFQGRSFLCSYSKASVILDSAVNLLKYIRTQTQILIQGYYITRPLVLDSQSQHHFFQTQSTIVEELHAQAQLQCVITQILSYYQAQHISQYTSALETSGWNHTIKPIHYCDVGDCVDDSATFIISFHNGIHGEHIKIDLPRPPPIKTVISDFIYTPFE